MALTEASQAGASFNFETIGELDALLCMVRGEDLSELEYSVTQRVRVVAETIADILDFDAEAGITEAQHIIPMDPVSLQPDYGNPLRQAVVEIRTSIPTADIAETYDYLKERMAS